MLAPTVRVCVACRQPIDPTEINRPRPTVATPESFAIPPRAERARFSWQIFLVVLAAWFLTASVAQRLLGPAKAQILLGSAVLLSSTWVLFDAKNKAIPKPFRWALGSLLLWILVFPWYLARRRTPRAVCRFVEADTGPLARALLLVLLVFFLLGIVAVMLKGPGG